MQRQASFSFSSFASRHIKSWLSLLFSQRLIYCLLFACLFLLVYNYTFLIIFSGRVNFIQASLPKQKVEILSQCEYSFPQLIIKSKPFYVLIGHVDSFFYKIEGAILLPIFRSDCLSFSFLICKRFFFFSRSFSLMVCSYLQSQSVVYLF